MARGVGSTPSRSSRALPAAGQAEAERQAIGYQAQITKTPVLDAGEEITRKLAFGYPEGSPPERLICFGNELPLQQK